MLIWPRLDLIIEMLGCMMQSKYQTLIAHPTPAHR